MVVICATSQMTAAPAPPPQTVPQDRVGAALPPVRRVCVSSRKERDRYRGRRRVPTPPRSRYAAVATTALIGAGVVAMATAAAMPDMKVSDPGSLAAMSGNAISPRGWPTSTELTDRVTAPSTVDADRRRRVAPADGVPRHTRSPRRSASAPALCKRASIWQLRGHPVLRLTRRHHHPRSLARRLRLHGHRRHRKWRRARIRPRVKAVGA